MCITNRNIKSMADWLANPLVREYSLASDWDNRRRTGGSVDEVIEEAHLDPRHILAGIERFVRDRGARLRRLREAVDSIEKA
jgi:transketolase